MSEQKPVKNAALARHWCCSAAYITKLKKATEEGGKAMPDFFALDDADAWRAVNAPPKKTDQTGAPSGADSTKNPVDGGKKIAFRAVTTTNGTIEPEAAAAAHERSPANNAPTRRPPSDEKINVDQFIVRNADFDALMIKHAEEVPQIAFGLLKLKATWGEAGAISAATKNWHEAAGAAASVREKFLDLQERTRALIQLDQVMDIVGTELQALRTTLLKLGERTAAKANPQDPNVARMAIDAAVDQVFRQLEVAGERVAKELAAP